MPLNARAKRQGFSLGPPRPFRKQSGPEGQSIGGPDTMGMNAHAPSENAPLLRECPCSLGIPLFRPRMLLLPLKTPLLPPH